MPELPDVTIYVERLRALVRGQRMESVRLKSPFLLRTVDPPLSAFGGLPVTGFERLGKRIVFVFEGELFLVIHLMIAGRLRWRDVGVPLTTKASLAAFDFEGGSLLLTEAGSKKRAALHAARGREALEQHDPGGVEVLEVGADTFAAVLVSENHTVKRALTDPHLFSGIGNAYSDEILHRARMSPMRLTQDMSAEEVVRLREATVGIMRTWTDRLRAQVGDGFPDKVTAFHKQMAVHGRYGKACPVCQAPVQRIQYASREANYCAACQTGGRLLADRVLSRLMRKDWPKTLEDLEKRRAKPAD